MDATGGHHQIVHDEHEITIPEDNYNRDREATFAKRLAILLHKSGVITDQAMLSLQYPSSADLEEAGTYNPFD